MWGTAVVAGDWPQWLGPNRDANSPEKVAPWKTDLKVLWRHPEAEHEADGLRVWGGDGSVLEDGYLRRWHTAAVRAGVSQNQLLQPTAPA